MMLRLRHTGIYVDNLRKMRDFYCNMLGMEIASEGVEGGRYIAELLGIPALSIEVCKLKYPDGSMIELIKPSIQGEENMHSSKVINIGCMHIAFTVQDLDVLCSKMKRAGISFISDPLLSPDSKVKVCFCKDPEGNYLELVQELV